MADFIIPPQLCVDMHFGREKLPEISIDVATVGLVLSFFLYTYGHRIFSRPIVLVGLSLILVSIAAVLGAVFLGPVDRTGRRLGQWFVVSVGGLLVLTTGAQFYGWGTNFKIVALEVYLIGLGFVSSSAVVTLLAIGLVIRSVVGLQTSPSTAEEIQQDVLDGDNSADQRED